MAYYFTTTKGTVSSVNVLKLIISVNDEYILLLEKGKSVKQFVFLNRPNEYQNAYYALLFCKERESQRTSVFLFFKQTKSTN